MYNVDNIASIGLKSEFLFFDHISIIYPKNEYVVVKTPRNPKYISANFLLFKNAPNPDDIELWPRLFQKEFLNNPNIKHIKLVWDDITINENVIDGFLKNNFELEHYRSLIATGLLTADKINQNICVRILNENDWEEVVQDQMLFRPTELSEDYYREFSKQLMDDYRSIILLNKSIWFGAYIGSQMIGSVGLLWSNTMVAFQRVLIKPEFRMHGACKTMLHYVAAWISNSLKDRTLVILAEKDSIAEKIYTNLGFKVKEELLAFYRYPNIE